MNKKRQILVAGMGTSPAVLTNAVWALAHQKKPIVPDEIVVFITKNGKTLLKKELFDGGVWADMLKCLAREGVDVEGKLMFGETSIRSIPDAKGNEMTCRIVGSQEAAPMHRVFSEESPFGRALIGAQEGDEVTVEAPMGNLIYRVKKIDH